MTIPKIPVIGESLGPEGMRLVWSVTDEPLADAPRLVLADWLSDRGDPRGEWLRWLVRVSGWWKSQWDAWSWDDPADTGFSELPDVYPLLSVRRNGPDLIHCLPGLVLQAAHLQPGEGEDGHGMTLPALTWLLDRGQSRPESAHTHCLASALFLYGAGVVTHAEVTVLATSPGWSGEWPPTFQLMAMASGALQRYLHGSPVEADACAAECCYGLASAAAVYAGETVPGYNPLYDRVDPEVTDPPQEPDRPGYVDEMGPEFRRWMRFTNNAARNLHCPPDLPPLRKIVSEDRPASMPF